MYRCQLTGLKKKMKFFNLILAYRDYSYIMISDDLHDLLNLLAAMIFADKRVFAREIETFLKMAETIRQLSPRDEAISEAKLLSWFDSNADFIREKLKTPGFESWFYECLDRLDNLYNKQALIDIMTQIARSDEEFHISEQALVVLTAKHWNLEYQL